MECFSATTRLGVRIRPNHGTLLLRLSHARLRTGAKHHQRQRERPEHEVFRMLAMAGGIAIFASVRVTDEPASVNARSGYARSIWRRAYGSGSRFHCGHPYPDCVVAMRQRDTATAPDTPCKHAGRSSFRLSSGFFRALRSQSALHRLEELVVRFRILHLL